MPLPGREHVVQAGETLSDIAAQEKVDLGSLVDFNALEDPALIHIGQVVMVPAAPDGQTAAPRTSAAQAASQASAAVRTRTRHRAGHGFAVATPAAPRAAATRPLPPQPRPLRHPPASTPATARPPPRFNLRPHLGRVCVRGGVALHRPRRRPRAANPEAQPDAMPRAPVAVQRRPGAPTMGWPGAA